MVGEVLLVVSQCFLLAFYVSVTEIIILVGLIFFFQQLVPTFTPKSPKQRGGFYSEGNESATLLQVLFGIQISSKDIQTCKIRKFCIRG